jgi:hypothetical protein
MMLLVAEELQMSVLVTRIKNGRITMPGDWPEGSEVEVRLHPPATEAEGESDVLSPNEIERVLQLSDEYYRRTFNQQDAQDTLQILDEISARDKATAAKFLTTFGQAQ